MYLPDQQDLYRGRLEAEHGTPSENGCIEESHVLPKGSETYSTCSKSWVRKELCQLTRDKEQCVRFGSRDARLGFEQYLLVYVSIHGSIFLVARHMTGKRVA